jgi:thymidylate kinase
MTPGITIVLCGPDGCGKTTAGRLVIERLSTTFRPEKGRHFHWKPAVFTGSRQSARGEVADPHDELPRNRAVSLVYFAFHWVEFFLGAYVRILPVKVRGGLVLIDRYYYDFFVDQRRYRLNVPQWLIRCGYALLKKPDLVFVLDAPAEVLQARKKEVPLAETERQRKAYLELASQLNNARIINAAQPPEKVAADIAKAVLDYLADRAGSRAAA